MSVTLPVTLVGTNTGRYQTHEAWKSGDVIRRIVFFWEEKRMRGAYVWSTRQGQYEGSTFGTPTGNEKSFEFEDGERITELQQWVGIWEWGQKGRGGHFRFNTSKGRSFSCGPPPLGDPRRIDVGYGILVGVVGYVGADIDSLGFIFLKPVIACTIQDVIYLDLTHTGTIVTHSLDSLHTTNDTTSPTEWKLEGQETSEVSWSFTSSQGLARTTSISMNLECGIPKLPAAKVGVEGSMQWEVSESEVREKSFKESRSLTWNIGGTLPAGKEIHAVAQVKKGKIDAPYRGTLRIRCEDGSVYTCPVSGTYKGVAITDIYVSVKKDAKATAKVFTNPHRRFLPFEILN